MGVDTAQTVVNATVNGLQAIVHGGLHLVPVLGGPLSDVVGLIL